MTVRRYVLFIAVLFAAGVLSFGCESQALFGVENTDNAPKIPSGEGKAFVQLEGEDTTTVSRGGTTSFTVSPNHTIGNNVKVSFEVNAGPNAQQGRDFVVQTSSPVTIPYDSLDGSVGEANIVINFPHSDQLNSAVGVTLRLTSAETDEGNSVPVGRGSALGNSDITKGQIKNIGIDWSKADLLVQGSSGFGFDDTAVGDTTTTQIAPFSQQGGFPALLADNDILVANLAGFRSTKLSNFRGLGDNPSFKLKRIYDPIGDALGLSQTRTPPFPLDPESGLIVVSYVIEFTPQSTGEKTDTLEFDATNIPASQKGLTQIPLEGSAVSN